jgi:hypothetical protein
MPDITAACLTSRTPTRHRTQAWSGPSIGVKKRHQGLGRFLHLAAIARSRADVTNSRIGAECAGDHADTGYKLDLSFVAAGPDPWPLLRTLLRLRHDLVTIGRAAVVLLPATFQIRFGPLLVRIGDTVAGYLRRGGEALAGRRDPPQLDSATAALDSFGSAFATARDDGLTRGPDVDTVERIFALGFALKQIRNNLCDPERCLKEAAREN